jgi:hypothetical protein
MGRASRFGWLLAVFAAVAALWRSDASAAGFHKSPFASHGAKPPLDIRVGFVLNAVEAYDVKAGTFEADFFVALTSAEPMPAVHLTMPNGAIDEDGRKVLADEPTFKLYRFTGKFRSRPNLHDYPFDEQTLRIQIEEDTYGLDAVRLVPAREHTDLATGFSIPGWDVTAIDARSSAHAYPDRFDDDDLYYGAYTFRLGIRRYALSALFKVFVPAFVIVLIGLMGMWVPPDEMEVRSNAGAPMLVAAVLFHYSLMQELPGTVHLTRADKLMIGVYGSLLLATLSTWALFLVDGARQRRLFKAARVAVPIATAVLMSAACLV